MGKKKPPPEKKGDVPEWFMTYSDVITLLMTFFILLLTFASNEPEQFERIKSSLFAGAGGSGIAGEPVAGIERESLLVRMRPNSARIAANGTEMPPIESDPSNEVLTDALQGLEDDEVREVPPRNLIRLPYTMLLEKDKKSVNSVGRQHLRMVGRQLRESGPSHQLSLGIHKDDDPEPVLVIAKFLMDQKVVPGQIAVSIDPALKQKGRLVKLEIIREAIKK